MPSTCTYHIAKSTYFIPLLWTYQAWQIAASRAGVSVASCCQIGAPRSGKRESAPPARSQTHSALDPTSAEPAYSRLPRQLQSRAFQGPGFRKCLCHIHSWLCVEHSELLQSAGITQKTQLLEGPEPHFEEALHTGVHHCNF